MNKGASNTTRPDCSTGAQYVLPTDQKLATPDVHSKKSIELIRRMIAALDMAAGDELDFATAKKLAAEADDFVRSYDVLTKAAASHSPYDIDQKIRTGRTTRVVQQVANYLMFDGAHRVTLVTADPVKLAHYVHYILPAWVRERIVIAEPSPDLLERLYKGPSHLEHTPGGTDRQHRIVFEHTVIDQILTQYRTPEHNLVKTSDTPYAHSTYQDITYTHKEKGGTYNFVTYAFGAGSKERGRTIVVYRDNESGLPFFREEADFAAALTPIQGEKE